MRLTQPLLLPPVFRYWKDFGAGHQRRMPHFKWWRHTWKRIIARKEIADHTLKPEQLPPGSRIMNGEDFMIGHIDAMPEELIRLKNEKVIYDHPWPYNVKIDPIKGQPAMRVYDINTRFYVPREDCQVLTNTLLESDKLEARPVVEPNDEQLKMADRHYKWSTTGDNVLVRQPKKREYPKINLDPRARYGIAKERAEVNVLLSLQSFCQTILASHLSHQGEMEKLESILERRSLAFPKCVAPFERQNKRFSMDLCVDNLSIGNIALPLLNTNPESTRERKPINIHPRSWKSLLEPTQKYVPDFSFSLPKKANPHTILLASRIKREHRDENDMLARSMIHSFGLASQIARLKAFEGHMSKVSEESNQASPVLLDPLGVPGVNDEDLLEQPIVLQSIGYDLTLGQFHFMRYQLNTLNFDDTKEDRIKNQAWYSGPIHDLRDVLRYYLDFQAFDSLEDRRQIGNAKRVRHVEEIPAAAAAAGAK